MRVVSQNRKISVDFDRTTFIRTDVENLHKAYAPVYNISDNFTEQQIKILTSLIWVKCIIVPVE